MQPTNPELFRQWFPAVIYEAGRFRVVASLSENKTVRDRVRFECEGRVADSMGKPAWDSKEVSMRKRTDLLEEALEAFVVMAAEVATADRNIEQVTR